MLRALVVAASIVGSGCTTLKDDSDVLHLEFSYHTGDEYIHTFRSFEHHGGEECLKDTTIHTVVMKITGVPEPRPYGWANAGLTGSMSCDDLKAWVLTEDG